jgi:hypothetical protein
MCLDAQAVCEAAFSLSRPSLRPVGHLMLVRVIRTHGENGDTAIGTYVSVSIMDDIGFQYPDAQPSMVMQLSCNPLLLLIAQKRSFK